ncbi:MAG: hypothetical protein AB1801_01570 [Chloroflexota bacterium]
MHTQNTGIKTDFGFVKQVMGIVTTFTLGIYLNFLFGSHLLVI